MKQGNPNHDPDIFLPLVFSLVALYNRLHTWLFLQCSCFKYFETLNETSQRIPTYRTGQPRLYAGSLHRNSDRKCKQPSLAWISAVEQYHVFACKNDLSLSTIPVLSSCDWQALRRRVYKQLRLKIDEILRSTAAFKQFGANIASTMRKIQPISDLTSRSQSVTLSTSHSKTSPPSLDIFSRLWRRYFELYIH